MVKLLLTVYIYRMKLLRKTNNEYGQNINETVIKGAKFEMFSIPESLGAINTL